VEIEILERDVLELPADERARLTRELLDSFDELPHAELNSLWWPEQAGLRAAPIDAGAVELVSGEEVDRKASVLLR
jgi:hypothetical protein